MTMQNTTNSTLVCGGKLDLQITYGVVGAVATISNGLILFIQASVEGVRNPPHIIPAIAASDLCMGLAAFIKVYILSTCQYSFTRFRCLVTESPFIVAAVSNSLLMLFLSTTRLLSYLRPQVVFKLYKEVWLMGMVHTLVLAASGGVVALYLLTIPGEERLHECSLIAAAAQYPAGKLVVLTLTVISFGTLMINFWLRGVVKKRLKDMTPNNQEGLGGQRDMKVAESIVIVCFIYSITWISGFVLRNLVINLVKDANVRDILAPYVSVFLSLNATTNFFVYASRSREYRSAFSFIKHDGGSKVTPIGPTTQSKAVTGAQT